MIRSLASVRTLALLLAVVLPGNLALAEERVPWTTSRIKGTPEPPPPYKVERLFPALTFNRPLDVAPLPGTDRLVVLGENGQMVSFVAKPDVDKMDSFGKLSDLDPEGNRAYSLAFHPKFKENRFVFCWMNQDMYGESHRKDGSRIIRFKVTEENPPKIDISSAKFFLIFRNGGHNGGNLKFGPDGMLYLGIGDGNRPDPPDLGVTGQDISDLFSSVLRIDVDHEEGDKPYSIPKDNPFLEIPS